MVVVHAFNASILQEAEAGRYEVQGQHGLQGELQDSQNYSLVWKKNAEKTLMTFSKEKGKEN